MSGKKWIVLTALLLGLPYLALGTLVALRVHWWADPGRAAADFLEALRKRDAVGIYLYADMLGPRLSGMMEKSKLTENEKKQLWAKDFGRWRDEFKKGSKSMDSLRAERELLSGQVHFSECYPAEYRAEVDDGQGLNLVSYRNVTGECYHRYFKLDYPSARTAPEVKLLQNIETALQRRIKSVIVRVELNRRPEVGPVESLVLDWEWLDKIAFIFPTGLFPAQDDPAQVWSAHLSFNVDKTTLETY